jgi:hypothetical protein
MTAKEKEPKEEKHAKTPMHFEDPVIMPTMINLTEFINTGALRKNFKVETLGGFLLWVKDKAPTKLPFHNWKSLLDQFANRIV